MAYALVRAASILTSTLAWTRNYRPICDMVFGMATTKITITLPNDQIDSIRDMVASGKTDSVSAFVKHAVDVALFDAAGWRAMLNDALQQTGGPLTNEERKWADSILRPSERKAERKKSGGSHNTGKNRAA